MRTIYAIRELSNNEILYIGSTNNLYNRAKSHRSACYCKSAKAHDNELYTYMRSKCPDRKEFNKVFEITELYKGECDNETERYRIEAGFIIEMSPVFNKNVPSCSQKEYKDLYKKGKKKPKISEDRRKRNKEWSETHPDYQKEWRAAHPHYHRDWQRNHPGYSMAHK